MKKNKGEINGKETIEEKKMSRRINYLISRIMQWNYKRLRARYEEV